MNADDIVRIVKADERFTHCRVSCELSGDGIATLRGMADSWRHVVDIGHLVARQASVVNVVNKLDAPGIVPHKPDTSAQIAAAKQRGVIADADIVIIGGGICGCAIARTLSRHQVNIILVEKNADVSEGATKANNGYIHPGHRAKPGTLKARLNVRGNALYSAWHEELGFPMLRYGQLNVARTEEDRRVLEKSCQDGLLNQVPGIRMLTPEEVRAMEPAVEGEVVAGLHIPSLAVVEPYSVCLALAENAVLNGARFLLGCEVLGITTEKGAVRSVLTEQGTITAHCVINCAGVHADDVAAMVGDQFFTIHARRGGLALFDKRVASPFSRSVSVPARTDQKDEESKGGGFSFTPEGNILVGPSAVEVPDKNDTRVEESDLEYAYARGVASFPGLRRQDLIAMYSGLRAADYTEDFIIGMSKKIGGFINVAGIQSPGLAAAPAIAEMTEAIVSGHMEARRTPLRKNPRFTPHRRKQVEFRRLNREKQDALIHENPAYGNIICRCEHISEGEILDAIRSPILPTTVDAIKRRTRAGMGRCQGGFCQPRVVEILARELGRDRTEILLKGRAAYILARKTREARREQD